MKKEKKIGKIDRRGGDSTSDNKLRRRRLEGLRLTGFIAAVNVCSLGERDVSLIEVNPREIYSLTVLKELRGVSTI